MAENAWVATPIAGSVALLNTGWAEPLEPSMNGTTGMADEAATFESVVLPHLDAAYRLARRLVANEHDAEDVVQEACMRALQYFRTFSGGNSRAWFLRIVRNTCSSWNRHVRQLATDVFDEEQHSTTTLMIDSAGPTLHVANALLIEHAMRRVPARFRELIVLRELEGLSYQETADVLGIPIGSVMSGLFRARQALRSAVEKRLRRTEREPANGRLRLRGAEGHALEVEFR